MMPVNSETITFMRDGLKDRCSIDGVVKESFMITENRTRVTKRTSIPDEKKPRIDSISVQKDGSAGEVPPLSEDDFIFEDKNRPSRGRTDDPERGSENAAGTKRDCTHPGRRIACRGLADVLPSAERLLDERLGVDIL